MTTSPAGRKLVASFEGYAPGAYLDQRGVRTLGVGHTLGVKMGDICTQAQADAWLEEDLATAEGAVNRLVPASVLNQNRFDALVDFCYNEGEGHLAESTVLKRLVQKPPDFLAAAEAFQMWNLIAGKVSPGLMRRRQAEMALFLTPIS